MQIRRDRGDGTLALILCHGSKQRRGAGANPEWTMLPHLDRDDANHRGAFGLGETHAFVAAASHEICRRPGLGGNRFNDGPPLQDRFLPVLRDQAQIRSHAADGVSPRILALGHELLVNQAFQDAMRCRAGQPHRLRYLAQRGAVLGTGRDISENSRRAPDGLRAVVLGVHSGNVQLPR